MGRKRKADEAFEISARDLLQQWNQYYTGKTFAIGIQCKQCKKWRRTKQFQESTEVPTDWNCSMWKLSNKKRGNCSIPSDLTEENFAQEEYPPGTVVWAKLKGFEWWPAMIEDCPDIQEYFLTHENGEDEYHVTFFGAKASRSWIKTSCIKEFSASNKPTKLSLALKKSIEQAEEAAKLPIKERLKKYSFAVRYKGRWAKFKDQDLHYLSLPPTCSWLKVLTKPGEVKSPATSDNRSGNRNVHLKPTPCVKKRFSVSKQKVEMKKQALDADEDQSSAFQGDNSSKTRTVVGAVKKEPVDQIHQQPSGDDRAQTAIRRDVVGRLKCYQSYQVQEYTRRDCTKSVDNGDRNGYDRPEEVNDTSADDEDIEDYDRGKLNVEGTRNLSIPEPPLADFDDSADDEDYDRGKLNVGGTRNLSILEPPLADYDDSADDEDYDSGKLNVGETRNLSIPEPPLADSDDCADDEDIEDYDSGKLNVGGTRNLSIPAPPLADSANNLHSSDDEGEENPLFKAYREHLYKKYPSFIRKLLSGTA